MIAHRTRVGAVVLAAGASSRMGGSNKLLEFLEGVPVVARVTDAVRRGGAFPVVVVTGHQADEVRGAITAADARAALLGHEGRAGLSPVEFIDNPDWSRGMSTSIAAGLARLEGRADAALICLGDMPRLMSASIAVLIATHRASSMSAAAARETAAWVPTFRGQPGNPVLWSAAWFDALRKLDGDRGAKSLIESLGSKVVNVEMPDDGVLIDVDTPEALERERTV